MRCSFVILVALFVSLPCWAAEKVKPNTLAPKEIADGWVLLFDGETAFGWDAAAKPRIEDGTLSFGGDKDILAAPTTAFVYYELHFDYRIEKTAKDTTQIMLRIDKEDRFSLTDYKDWAKVSLTVDVGRIQAKVQHLGKEGGFEQSSSSVDIRIRPEIPSFRVPKGCKLSLRNIKLKPLNSKPIFNGKDLSGWKKYEGDTKRAKSQFTITKDGLLNIKNGPGDLQTIGQWTDFVLQLDCRINGDNLNSGVFFRCIPGEYQNGYEAQIKNTHAKEPKTYIIAEYDPKTHKIKSKKAVQNWSQDYGTGAIYRRVPARRAVAKDREWFTMTIAAHGRHIATWVNGIQTTDWTDNRPENDNPRKGCRLKKGAISLQGHDPSTNLSFRHLRIADLNGKR